MAKWWMHGALVAVWLTGAPLAHAQYLHYTQPPQMPEPVPSGPIIPGPVPPWMAPQGPGDDMSLPGNYPNSFTGYEESKPPDKEWYFHIGMQALLRQRPTKHVPLALLDPQNLDTGDPPGFHVQDAQKFGELQPNYALGVRTSLMYRWDNHMIEFSGFYQPDNEAMKETVVPGRLDLGFINPPVGFEGDNGMWLQADRVRTLLSTSLGSAELNYRCWSDALTGVELIGGVRYFDLNEHYTIFTDDDGVLIRDVIFNVPDPVRQAYYILHAHNRLVAPQLGFEWDWKLTDWLVLNWHGKGAWGANFVEQTSQLIRGDGLRGRLGRKTDTHFSHFYETGLYFDIYLGERIRWRMGYDWMILAHAIDVANEVDFDLSHSINRQSEFKNIFFHGPVFEFQFVF